MQLHVLGSAAGGGSPQWNCGCPVCRAVREGEAGTEPRTQSSLAVRGSEGPWFLVCASPDLRQQVEALPDDFRPNDALRYNPFAGVLLTDAEVDHAAGLLLLRESRTPLEVFATDGVRRALTEDWPLLVMLERYCGVDHTELVPGTELALPGSSLVVEPFALGGDPPLYARASADDPTPSIGLTFRDAAAGPHGGSAVTWVPALERLDEGPLLDRLRASDVVLVDGTFWTADELTGLGIGTRDANAMGHQPLSGKDGTLLTLSELPGRVVLVHVNNSNPVLRDGPERRELVAARIELAHDGMEIEA